MYTIAKELEEKLNKLGGMVTNDKRLAKDITDNHWDEFDVYVDGDAFVIINREKPVHEPTLEELLPNIFGTKSEHECHCGGECGGCGCHCDETDEETLEAKLDDISAKLDHLVDMFDLVCTLMYLKEAVEE